MRKIFLMTIGWFGMQTAFSQSVTKNVGDFTGVKVFDKIRVELVASSKNEVEIVGSDTDNVQIINKNGELKIRMTTVKTLQGDGIKVVVYYKDLQGVEANEGTVVTNLDKIKSSSLTLNAKEGASINVGIEAQKLNIQIVTGGIVEVSGEADTQDVLINTGAKYYAKDLKTKQTTVTINAGGEAEVFVSKQVDAKIRAGGTIDIYGNPDTVNKKTSLGGRITVH
ncbi:MAG: DUF2807 domain-containing protein [Flavobacteriaceae bacterium]|jgi:hypothetical protein|nr:DUF2807 domain-containing protein [Flavobacteriaceae bacterium]